MARQSFKKVKLKDGFYFTVQSKLKNEPPIKIRRKSKREIDLAMRIYSRFKTVNYFGEVKDGQIVT